MLKLLAYLLSRGVVTEKKLLPDLDSAAKGIPKLTKADCLSDECSICEKECPTDAITLAKGQSGKTEVKLDRGKCITCSLCIDLCPTGTIVSDRNPVTASKTREALILSTLAEAVQNGGISTSNNPFHRSVAARVVSTGCSACDLEISAAGNPIFDMERFGVHVVASPRFADVLLVTGPVPKAMQEPLRRCYEAMAEPRRVIAVGTCAISGGVHANGYTDANGAAGVVPVDVFIPGCPPHPWSIIAGILMAMDRLPASRLQASLSSMKTSGGDVEKIELPLSAKKPASET